VAVNLCEPVTPVPSGVTTLLRGWGEHVSWNPLALYCTAASSGPVDELPPKFRRGKRLIPRAADLSALHAGYDLLYCPMGGLGPLPPPHPCAVHLSDILDYFFPGDLTAEEMSLRRNQYRNVIAFADKVLVPSGFAKRSLEVLLGIPAERVAVAPLPVSDLSYKATIPPSLPGGFSNFIYYPSDDRGHKNHARLFRALAELKAGGLQVPLLCSGPRHNGARLAELAAAAGLKDQYFHLGHVTREEVSWLYRSARFVVLPSLFETYGSPVIEGFMAGTPVLCSGVASLPEIGGGAVLYCDPFDVSDLSAKIGKLWGDHQMRDNLAKLGKERVGLFAVPRLVKQHYGILSGLADLSSKGRLAMLPDDPSLPPLDASKAFDLYRLHAVEGVREKLPAIETWAGCPDTTAGPPGEAVSVLSPPPVRLVDRDLAILSSGEVPEVHFFTIVLNGMPFIRQHIEVFRRLPFDWHWHIVEGVAELVRDTAWSKKRGGRIPDTSHRGYRSVDGTSGYLDDLARDFPDRVSLYRKDTAWFGKLEMIDAPLARLGRECLLWEVDVDELWSVEQIDKLVAEMTRDPERSGALFFSRMFAGNDRILDNLGSFGNDPEIEWRRVWRYRPGDYWASYEPPKLMRRQAGRPDREVIGINPFTHQETWSMGLAFEHYAYATEEQMRFKESYLGESGSLIQWLKLQRDPRKEVLAGEFFPWIEKPVWAVKFDPATTPRLARREPRGWRFGISALESDPGVGSTPQPTTSSKTSTTHL